MFLECQRNVHNIRASFELCLHVCCHASTTWGAGVACLILNGASSACHLCTVLWLSTYCINMICVQCTVGRLLMYIKLLDSCEVRMYWTLHVAYTVTWGNLVHACWQLLPILSSDWNLIPGAYKWNSINLNILGLPFQPLAHPNSSYKMYGQQFCEPTPCLPDQQPLSHGILMTFWWNVTIHRIKPWKMIP